MGEAGGPDAEYGAHGSGASCLLPQRTGMGAVHGCCDHGGKWPGAANRVYSLGKGGTGEMHHA